MRDAMVPGGAVGPTSSRSAAAMRRRRLSLVAPVPPGLTPLISGAIGFTPYLSRPPDRRKPRPVSERVMGLGVAAGGGLALRLAALLLVVANLGLPINELAAYALLVVAALLILTGTPCAEPRRWLAAVALTAVVVGAHLLWPAPRIDEGHNVFLPGPSAAQNLPLDVLKGLD